MAATLCGSAGTMHITIEQGATFKPVLTWRDQVGGLIDLTGYIARMHIRNEITDTEFLYEATSANTKIILGDAAGTITFDFPASDTALMSFDEAVYDLELESSGGEVTRLLQGDVYLSPEVTR